MIDRQTRLTNRQTWKNTEVYMACYNVYIQTGSQVCPQHIPYNSHGATFRTFMPKVTDENRNHELTFNLAKSLTCEDNDYLLLFRDGKGHLSNILWKSAMFTENNGSISHCHQYLHQSYRSAVFFKREQERERQKRKIRLVTVDRFTVQLECT